MRVRKIKWPGQRLDYRELLYELGNCPFWVHSPVSERCCVFSFYFVLKLFFIDF